MALAGFLAGRAERVHFTDDLEGAEVTLRFYTPGVRLLPAAPLQAFVGSSLIPDPLTFIAVMAERPDPVYIRVDFAPSAVPQWYEELLAEEQGEPGAAGDEERLEGLRQRLDSALDIYNECRRILAEGAGGRDKELQLMRQLAREEMDALGREIARLKARIDSM